VLCFILGNAAIHGQNTAISSVAPPSTIYYLEPLGKKPEVDKTQPPLAPRTPVFDCLFMGETRCFHSGR
jgi:hypothetical protein